MATRIVAISGSLRQGSHNSALLAAAAARMPQGATLEIVSLRGIPLYDGDREETEFPAEVTALKDAIAAADGLLLAAPEYNNSVPGVAKNALDWASRPPKDQARVFGDKAVAICGASIGGYGTVLGQAAWLPVFRVLGCRLWSGGRLMVPNAGQAFEDGKLVDEELGKRIQKFMAGFVAFAAG